MVVFEDFPSIILTGYVAARLVVLNNYEGHWRLISLVSILFSEISFVKLGRQLSYAGFTIADTIPVLFLAFCPPGLHEKNLEGLCLPTRIFNEIEYSFDDEDNSIEDINRLLGSRWV
jgi:hypothetical protein